MAFSEPVWQNGGLSSTTTVSNLPATNDHISISSPDATLLPSSALTTTMSAATFTINIPNNNNTTSSYGTNNISTILLPDDTNLNVFSATSDGEFIVLPGKEFHEI